MDLGANKTLVEIIKESAFGGTYLRDMYSSINGKWHRKSWKEFDELKYINQNYYCSNYYDVSANKYSIKCGTPLRFFLIFFQLKCHYSYIHQLCKVSFLY